MQSKQGKLYFLIDETFHHFDTCKSHSVVFEVIGRMMFEFFLPLPKFNLDISATKKYTLSHFGGGGWSIDGGLWRHATVHVFKGLSQQICTVLSY